MTFEEIPLDDKLYRSAVRDAGLDEAGIENKLKWTLSRGGQ